MFFPSSKVALLLSFSAVGAVKPDVGRRVSPEELTAAVERREEHHRELYDVDALVVQSDASILEGDNCTCPLLATNVCEDARIYNNLMYFRPATGEPATFLFASGERQLIDAFAAGSSSCQALDGIELCFDPECTPVPNYIMYDCDKLAETLVGVAFVRAERDLKDTPEQAVLDALETASNGTISGDDEIWAGLDVKTVYLYLAMESTGNFSCSDGCNLYEACSKACIGNGGSGFNTGTQLELSSDCVGEVEVVDQPVTTPPPPDDVVNNRGSSKKKKSGAKAAAITITLVVVLVFLCLLLSFCFVYFMWNKRQAEYEEAAEDDETGSKGRQSEVNDDDSAADVEEQEAVSPVVEQPPDDDFEDVAEAPDLAETPDLAAADQDEVARRQLKVNVMHADL